MKKYLGGKAIGLDYVTRSIIYSVWINGNVGRKHKQKNSTYDSKFTTTD